VVDFYQLGLDNLYPVSALHNKGVEELLYDVIKQFPEPTDRLSFILGSRVDLILSTDKTKIVETKKN